MTNVKRTLYRLPKQGKIFGVCAGLAEYFDMDVTLMRVVYVLITFATGGAMVMLYVILALILPVSDAKKNQNANLEVNDNPIGEKIERLGKDLKENGAIFRARNYMGIFLIIIGTWLLLSQFMPDLLNWQWDYVWPILLILAGILVLFRGSYGRK